MDIERLNELRKRLEYNSELEDEEIENLWELIDEAIARQSVKSEDVAEAMEILRLNSEFEKVIGENGDIENQTYLNALDLAITALQAYEPTTRKDRTVEDVAEAIEWVTNTRHGNQYMSGDWTAPMYNHINRTIQDTIIAALQAYQPKNPCVICENGDDEFVCFEDDGERIKNEAEARAIIARGEQYCRFCGRKLKGDNA